MASSRHCLALPLRKDLSASPLPSTNSSNLSSLESLPKVFSLAISVSQKDSRLRVLDIEWRYSARDNMTSFFSPHMGGAQRLPGGNALICEGNKGCVFEVTPDGDIVREFVSPHFVQSEQFGRHNWLFRARWYAPDSPEIRAVLG